MKQASRIVAILACVAMVASLAGCSIPGLGGGEKPTLTVVAPPDGAQVQVGQEAMIQSISMHSDGVSRVDLTVDGALLRSDASADPGGEPTLNVSQGWTPDTAGVHTIVVQAFSSGGEASDPVSITLNAVAAEETPTPSPTPTTEAEDEPKDEDGDEDKCDDAAYVSDITVPDGTTFAPGASFAKTWRVRNTGACDWDAGYQLTFQGGDQLGAASGVNVVATPAGAEVDITVNMFAPAEAGDFTGRWQMQNPDGESFGETLTVVIKVEGVATATPTSTTTPDEVKIEFWADSETINQGECTIIHWKVENAQEVYYEEGGVVGEGEREECPGVTKTYRLRVIHAGGETTEELEITVEPAGGGEDEFSNFQVVEETSDSIRIRVDYNYASDHGDQVRVSAYAYGSGAKLAGFGFAPGTADAGSGTTDVILEYHGAGSVTSDEVELRLYPGGGAEFYSQRFDFDKTWDSGGDTDSFSNFQVEEIDENTIRITIDYNYASSHGDPAYVGAYAYSGGSQLSSTGYTPGEMHPGSDSTQVLLEYYGSGTPTSDQIQLEMYPGGGVEFHTQQFDYDKTWGS